ncbi:hypothetical protein [Fluviicola chungangensis]|uniref:Uncharacterized protein n=1 Tax=Fluviicola chungangensis TaxID=2597671 RepID=A0A556N682_9FLAO|nr:hypothetical protein [Fluviicola chungangensis]TSJ47601.1 hypothetical protein FO442_00290 [Fluviicola chungangensis]
MKKYSTVITDHLGTQSAFEVSIDEKRKQGKVRYLNEEYDISRCAKTSANELFFWMHIGEYIKLKVVVSSQCGNEKNYLVFSNTRYLFDAESCSAFQQYTGNLKLPLAEPFETENQAESTWTEALTFKGLKPHFSVYLAWFPFDEGAFVKFIHLAVNNREIDLSTAYEIPGGGLVVPIGNYLPNQEYILSWKCETSYTPSFAKTAVGYFVNNDLNTRKVLRVRNVSHYEEWTDSATLVFNTTVEE